jgi:toxin ParE1/3/4
MRLYDWVADASSEAVALAYVERIESFCLRLAHASERGHRRDDIRPGLRIIGFKRRVTIAFTADEAVVTILRVFYGGQNWEDSMK